MMMKLVHLFSTALLSIPFVCDAQPREEFNSSSTFEVSVPDTFSLEEMKKLWSALPAERPLSYRVDNKVGIEKSPHFSCPKLKKSENDLIVEYGVWNYARRPAEGAGGGRIHTLYLVDIKDPRDSLLAKSVYNKLRKVYGQDSCGIPAKWVTGHVTSLYQPYSYLNTTVSYYSHLDNVNGGVIVGRYDRRSKGRYRREADLFSLTLDGVWVDERITYELFLFAHEMNLDMDLDPVHRVVSYFCVEVLLYIDGLGRASIHPLQYEKELDDYQKEQFSKLQEAVSKLPPWRFGVLYNADGRIFPGRYLTADFTRGQGWRFKDYLLK